MTLAEFNFLPEVKRKKLLFQCCGCTPWVEQLVSKTPFNSMAHLKQVSDAIWKECKEPDLLEAFSHHPVIGNLQALEKKFASTRQFASAEQAAVGTAEKMVLNELESANASYYKKFGFIFIVCASGKSADEMLDLLKKRIVNNREEELQNAAGEQNKITHIRLDKLIS